MISTAKAIWQNLDSGILGKLLMGKSAQISGYCRFWVAQKIGEVVDW